jgi:hypothetical protein
VRPADDRIEGVGAIEEENVAAATSEALATAKSVVDRAGGHFDISTSLR